MKVDFISQEIFNNSLNLLIENALAEDIGNGDHTTLSTIHPDSKAKAKLLVKDNGIIAGISLAETIFNKYDKRLSLEIFKSDGDSVSKGDIVFIVNGPAQSILSTERLVLNFMQHLSGIATQTNEMIKLTMDYKVKLLDTRKTIPGLRLLEKWAVGIGGGFNHRIGLYDMILIKDNHIDHAGGITKAVNKVTEYISINNLNLKIEVEVRNINDVKEALLHNAIDRLLLDNFSPENMKIAVDLIDGKVETEASGGITSKNIVKYAATGVDYISVGALTHTIVPLDLSLKIF